MKTAKYFWGFWAWVACITQHIAWSDDINRCDPAVSSWELAFDWKRRHPATTYRAIDEDYGDFAIGIGTYGREPIGSITDSSWIPTTLDVRDWLLLRAYRDSFDGTPVDRYDIESGDFLTLARVACIGIGEETHLDGCMVKRDRDLPPV